MFLSAAIRGCQGLKLAPHRSVGLGDALADIGSPRAGVGGEIQQDLQLQLWDAVAGAAQRQRTVPPRLMPITIPPRTICASLLAKPGRHFRGMGIDDIAPEVAFDRGARVGDDVGGPE